MNFLDSFSENNEIKFHENSSGGSHSCFTRIDGRTDRHDEANSLVRNFTKTPKKNELIYPEAAFEGGKWGRPLQAPALEGAPALQAFMNNEKTKFVPQVAKVDLV